MDLRQRFRSGFGWTVLGTACSQGSTLLSYLLVGNLIGRDGLGLFSIVLATINTFVSVLQMSSGYTAAKYVSEFRNSQPDRAARILMLCWALSAAVGVVGAFGLCIAAAPLAASWLKIPSLAGKLQVAALAIPFGTLTSLYLGALTGLGRFKLVGISGVVAGVVGCLSMIVATQRWGIQGAVAGIVVTNSLQCLCLHLFLRRAVAEAGLRLHLSGILQEKSVIWRFALPAALSGLTAMPAVWIGNCILSSQQDGPRQMGGFTAAFTLRSLVLVLPGLMNTVGLSLLNSQMGLQDRDAYAKTFRMNFFGIVGVAILGSLGVLTLGPFLLRAFGKDFESARPLLPILLVSSVIEAITIAVYQLIQTRARMWLSFLVNAIPRDCAIVVMSLVLIPKYGSVGLVWAYAVSWALTLVTVTATAVLTGRSVQVNEVEVQVR